MKFTKFADTLHPSDAEAVSFLIQAPEGAVLEFKSVTHQRTSQQNNSIWKYCAMLAKALSEAGFDQRTYPFREGLQIPFTKESVMEIFWRPVQEAMLGKGSTTDLNTTEVNTIYEALDRANSERTGVHVPFPSKESLGA